MHKISVDILGRHLGVAMSSDEKSYQAFTVYGFQPVPDLKLPELCDLVIDCAHGWVIPIRGDGGGEFVPSPADRCNGSCVIDLVDLLQTLPRK
ncbi:MAG: hypothetical protein JOY71_10095 [Acetobacteraceae bacterium]|nr:hypothetical protein [Acetobacteraceae bacterium]